MKMTYSQYCRIESKAGGIACTPREFIRAARSKLSGKGKARAARELRHSWIRDGLRQLCKSRRMLARSL